MSTGNDGSGAGTEGLRIINPNGNGSDPNIRRDSVDAVAGLSPRQTKKLRVGSDSAKQSRCFLYLLDLGGD
jgi:hypothetical protein